MTPQSDVDLIIISPSPTGRVRTKILAALRELPYDKLDVPHWSSPRDLATSVHSGSPESGHADVAFLVGDRTIVKDLSALGILEHYYSAENMRATIVFNHFFIDWDSRKKSSRHGPNLKYSKGGTRELLLLDWHFVAAQPSPPQRTDAEPRIVSAIRSFRSRGILSERSAIDLANAIDLVVCCKFRTLELLRSSEHRGRGWMNPNCAGALVATYGSEFARFDIRCARDLMLRHTRARATIHGIRHELFRHFIAALDADVCRNVAKDILLGDLGAATMIPYFGSATLIEKLGMIWRATEENDKRTLDWIVQREASSTEFRILASLLTAKALEPTVIARIAGNQASDPGNEYLNRLIIRHPRTRLDTLRRLTDGRRLAIADEVDRRYRKVLLERCRDAA